MDPEAAATIGGELVATVDTIVSRVSQFATVDSVADLQDAVIARQQIGAAIGSIEAFFHPLKAMAHQLHAALCARERTIVAPLRALDEDTRRAMADFKAREDRARRDRERAIADQRRRDDDARALAEAAALEKSGDHRMAAAVVAEAIAAPSPVVALPDATKAIDGLTFRRVWKWRYTDTGDELPREFLKPDETKITRYVQTMKASGAIAGIEIYYDDLPVR